MAGEMSDSGERRTGATEDLASLTGVSEAAIGLAEMAGRGTYTQLMSLSSGDPWRSVAIFMARQLVPFGHRIVAADLLRRAAKLAEAGAEWREADADERGGLNAECRKFAAIMDLIEAVDGISADDLAQLRAAAGEA